MIIFVQDIPPPVYTNVVTNNQTGESENEHAEATQHSPVHSTASPQVFKFI